ncbi:unnamed protein product [Blepharisma stoltei]|uniref:Protein kinase domain-containing protein n=1 Tax=Blepharisma stoltei TaxID=1481888 RepID=A0AAU9JWE7_9CILI|nr:unnamed protein product [Blepharisma stoltei]
MGSVLEQIFSKIVEEMEKDRIDTNSILPAIDTWSLQELEKWLIKAEDIFWENKKLLGLARDFYTVSKIDLIIDRELLTPKIFELALDAIDQLSRQFRADFKNLIIIEFHPKIEQAIQSSGSAEIMIEWWTKADQFQKKIGNEKAEYFKQLVKSRLDSIYRERAKSNPRSTLLALAQLKIVDIVDINDLVEFSMKTCLEQVQNEWYSCKSEFVENLKRSIGELLQTIEIIQANKNIKYDISKARKTLWRMLRYLEKKATSISPEFKEIKTSFKVENDQDLPIDRARIREEIFLPFKYIKSYLEIFMHQGILDDSKKVCIFYFYVSSNEHYQIFNREKKLIKHLSGKHKCFLKYHGWFNCIWSINDQYFNVYALVTGYFNSTLIENIMSCSKFQAKYNQRWFLDAAKDLLHAFDYLEKSNIPHYDIRPQNIFITKSNKLKIFGFNFQGINLVSISESAVEGSQEMLRDSYLAPELYNNKEFNINEISSVMKAGAFSLGLVFLQMYSLYKIAELNTPEFHGEIDDYVSTFKPKLVSELLRRMLNINKNKRATFCESLELLSPKEESKEDQEENLKSHRANLEQINKILERRKRIEPSGLKPNPKSQWSSKTLENGTMMIFKKGVYENEFVLIRTFKSNKPEQLFPFLEEAEILEKLDDNPVFIKYYGCYWHYNQTKLLCSLSLITELCERSLMTDITARAQAEEKNYYNQEELKPIFEWLLQGFIALKDKQYDHDNIKPHLILLNKHNHIKISGFLTPKYKIESFCMFPSPTLQLLQDSSGYLSPEKLRSREEKISYDIESSDVFSLGLVFLQMYKLEAISSWDNDRDFPTLQKIYPTWVARLLQKMLLKRSVWRPKFREIYDKMQKYIRDDGGTIENPLVFR